MPLSNATNGIASWGIPAGLANPAAMRAAAYNASVFHLDPRRASGGNGKSAYNAFTSLTSAEDAVTSELGDLIIFQGTDNTTGSSSRDTATVTWDKGGATVIGACAPVHVSQRARVAPSTSFAGPLLTVSGNNNAFMNMQFFQGHNAASTCVSVTGDRNFFYNCHIAGIGHATAGDDAASESLLLSGEENLFVNCTIGLDTIARSAACAEIRTAATATRNSFVGCRITGYADNAGALFVDIPSSSIDRYIRFHDCEFFNPIDSAATAMTVGMSIHASAGGTVILTGSSAIYGATDWASDFANTAVALHACDAAGTMGIAINGS